MGLYPNLIHNTYQKQKLINITTKQQRVQRSEETLSEFKEYLTKFRNLEKEKNAYLGDQAFKKTFSIYLSFSNFEVTHKSKFLFSECFIDSDEASKVQSGLCHCHKKLINLYGEIIEYEGKGST